MSWKCYLFVGFSVVELLLGRISLCEKNDHRSTTLFMPVATVDRIVTNNYFFFYEQTLNLYFTS